MFGKVKSVIRPKSADESASKGSASAGAAASVAEPPPLTPEPPRRSAAEAKVIDDRVRAYNELKTRIHRKLVEKLDLQRQ